MNGDPAPSWHDVLSICNAYLTLARDTESPAELEHVAAVFDVLAADCRMYARTPEHRRPR